MSEALHIAVGGVLALAAWLIPRQRRRRQNR